MKIKLHNNIFNNYYLIHMDNINDTKYMKSYLSDDKDNIQFVHFTTIRECDDFIKYIIDSSCCNWVSASDNFGALYKLLWS